MKGIILAAGRGTRLGPITCGIGGTHIGASKPLVPTFDKPTIYYPLSDLVSAGIRDILVIAAPDNVDQFAGLLGDGSSLGISLSYTVQPKPRGIAEAFVIAEQFIGNDDVMLAFGDNIFSGKRFTSQLRESTQPTGATVFAYHVNNPSAFGVVEFDRQMRAISLEEKPSHPKSDFAVVGIYAYDNRVVDIAKQLTPSQRGELEITDVNKAYLEAGLLDVRVLDSDTNWFDTGTPESLLGAAVYVDEFQRRTGELLGSPEAAAYQAGTIDRGQLIELAATQQKTAYGRRLMQLAQQ